MSKMLSAAASPLCSGSLTCVSRLMGENSMPIAPRKETKAPTVRVPSTAWRGAMKTMAARPDAVVNWTSGTFRPAAARDLKV